MKITKFKFIFFIILFLNASFAKKESHYLPKIIDQIKNENSIIKTFPKTIKNAKEFEVALLQIDKLNQLLRSRKPLDLNLSELVLPVKNCITWSEKFSTLEKQLQFKMFYLAINYKLGNVKEILESGNELFLYKENMVRKDINFILNSLYFGYKKSEAYNEIIKITPIRKKYADLSETKISTIENDLALAYFNSKNYKFAAESFLIVKEYFRAENDYLFVASMSNNIGLCYLKLYDFKTARNYFDLSKKELQKTKNKESKNMPIGYNVFFEAVINSNIAAIDVENGDYELAISKFKNLKQQAKKIGDFESYNISESFLNISKIYMRKNDLKLAQIYLDSAKINLQKLVSTNTKIEIKNLEAKLFLLNGNAQRAALLFDDSKKLADSIAQIQIGRENIMAQAKYNSDEKDIQLKTANTNLKIQEDSTSMLRIGLAITAILFAIIGFLYYQKTKGSKIIDKQNDILKTNLKEKEMLLKEVHHRVKNNLQVISGLLQLESEKHESPQIELMIQNSNRQINSIALMHQMLYQNEDYMIVSIKEYIKKLTNQLLFSTYGTDYKVNINVNELSLSTDVVIPIGLIISELFINSHKHAFADQQGIIDIELTETGHKTYQFKYSDNGCGLESNNENDATTGFSLLKMLAEEISGTLSINGSHGFEAIINFTENEKK